MSFVLLPSWPIKSFNVDGKFYCRYCTNQTELGSDIAIVSLGPGNCKVVLQLEFQGAGVMFLWIPAFIGKVFEGGNSSKVRLVLAVS